MGMSEIQTPHTRLIQKHLGSDYEVSRLGNTLVIDHRTFRFKVRPARPDAEEPTDGDTCRHVLFLWLDESLCSELETLPPLTDEDWCSGFADVLRKQMEKMIKKQPEGKR